MAIWLRTNSTKGCTSSVSYTHLYADFYLNGRLIGSTDNALIPHRLPLPGLRQGENELVCVLRSCLAEAGSHPVSVGDYALHYNYASLRVRKAPSAYGWDIMPVSYTHLDVYKRQSRIRSAPWL